MDDLKVAAVCMNSAPGKVEKNLARIQSFVLEAAEQGAHIICFPELSVTGYTLKNPGDIYGVLDSSRAMEALVRMAGESRLLLIAGLIEHADEKELFITQVIAGPDGLIGLYRKSHLSPHEKEIYKPGEQINIFSYGNTLFGVQLCYEAHFPEISTAMALMGADVIFIPHASPRGDAEGKLESWLRHLTARAFDNGVFVVACNQVGDTDEGFFFPGVAVAVGPDGQVLTSHTGEGETILYAVLDTEKLKSMRQHKMKYFLPQRRPALYRTILHQKNE